MLKKILRGIRTGLLGFCVLFTLLALIFGGLYFRDFANLFSVWGIVNTAYIESPDRDSLIAGASRGLVKGLEDPYSEYVTGEEYQETLERLSGAFAGLGIYFTMEEEIPTVVYVFPESPAEKAGLVNGDRILSAGDTEFAGMEMDQVSEVLKGPEGSLVTILVEREDGTRVELDIIRESIEYQTIYSSRLESDPDIGYVHISSFSQKTPEQLGEALEGLGDIRGLVLDLRQNGGGEVTGALGTAAYFLPKGPIIFEESRYNIRTQEAMGGNTDMPLVVLVNGNSASAAEIVAGAIQDTGRAMLVGEQTFGKGIVQRYFPTWGGDWVKLTVTRYLTPKKRSIHGEGLTPDRVIPMTEEQYMEALYGETSPDPAADPQLQEALDLLTD